MQPVGGWAQRGSVTVAGAPRTALTWRDNTGNKWAAFAGHDSLRVMSTGNVVSDITPSDLEAGRQDAGTISGYGAGDYGQGVYGHTNTGTTVFPATVWHLDHWGEYLVGCSPDDGRLLEWRLDPGTAAQVIDGAPTQCSGLMVTQERFLFAFGAGGDPRRVQWSDQANNTEWRPTALTQAGDRLLETDGEIMRGVRVRGESLVLTSTDAHAFRYLNGDTLVYESERVGVDCGLIARGAVAEVAQGAVWMGRRGFYRYLGGSVEEIPCEVADHVFGDMNETQASKITAVNLAEYGEIWWFYPGDGETEPDRYVALDMREGIWMTGEIGRLCGSDAGVWAQPLWVGTDGTLYEHETGLDHGAATPYAQTGPIALGGRTILGRGLYPDELTRGDVTVNIKTRFSPNGAQTDHGPYTLADYTGVRFAGRQMQVLVSAAKNADWRWGVPFLDYEEGGWR